MREHYEVRVAIEELIVRRAASGAGDRVALRRLRAQWQRLEAEDATAVLAGADFVVSDEAFHTGLATAAGNDAAARLLDDVNARIRILRIHDFTTDDRIGATITEHLEILAGVVSRDPDAAAAFMRAHVQRSALVVRERVGSALARMFELPG